MNKTEAPCLQFVIMNNLEKKKKYTSKLTFITNDKLARQKHELFNNSAARLEEVMFLLNLSKKFQKLLTRFRKTLMRILWDTQELIRFWWWPGKSHQLFLVRFCSNPSAIFGIRKRDRCVNGLSGEMLSTVGHTRVSSSSKMDHIIMKPFCALHKIILWIRVPGWGPSQYTAR